MRKFLGGAVAAGAAVAAYSLYEPYRFQIVTRRVPARRGAPDLTVLHLSDTHVTAGDRARLRFIKEVPARLGEVPDLLLVTGDMIEDDGGIDPLLEALAGYESRAGAFYVLGSHDYYQSRFKPPTQYFSRRRGPVKAPRADTARLEEGFEKLGWTPLTNKTETAKLAARRSSGAPHTIRLAGVDDPYLRRHRTAHISRRAGDDYAIGLTHSPDVVSEYALNGFDLVLAGHTHGGQVRMPGVGALVTNSSLPSALAGGLHRVGDTWLHVTNGLGTSRFTPIRFLARPDVTLLRISPEA